MPDQLTTASPRTRWRAQPDRRPPAARNRKLEPLRPAQVKPLKQPSARRSAPHANATLSGAWPFANYPAKRGVRVFAIDVRCFGRSVCPQGDAAGRVVDDLVAAVAQLRQTWGNRGGARRRVDGRLGGADRRQASKASSRRGSKLSCQAKPISLLRIPLNGRGAVQQLTVQTKVVVATHDQDTSVDETRVMYQPNKAAGERLLLVPGQFDGFRGWMVLHNTSGGFFLNHDYGRGARRRPQPDAVQRMFSGVWHNMSHKLRPAGGNSGTGRAHARWNMGPDGWADRACGGGGACGSGQPRPPRSPAR
jgi:hypothetical protein